jgi:ABC-2 type transport system ATP-binding protein
MSQHTPAISAENITKSYGDKSVLKGISISIPKGSIFAILGPNGAGKTTFVRILSTLLRADGGTATVGGFDVATQAEQVRRIIGLTGQYASVDDKLTGLANLEVIGQLYHLSKKDAQTRAKELIERFELTDAAHRAVKTYSGGMRRRLDLAASLIISPPIIFLDEPTTGLDPHSRITMWKIIDELIDDGATILLTTQYLEEADQLADIIAVIDHGVVIAQGTADELKAKVGGERLDIFLGSETDLKKAVDTFGARIVYSLPQDRKISFALEGGVSQTAKLFTELDAAGITVTSFSTHRPTLDDVFLTLTGHEADLDGAPASTTDTTSV